jgi:hypothetical protein
VNIVFGFWQRARLTRNRDRDVVTSEPSGGRRFTVICVTLISKPNYSTAKVMTCEGVFIERY